MIEIVNFIRHHGLDKLDELGIMHNIHSIFPNLYLFKYHTLHSPMENPVVQDARGIVLDADNDWLPVCFPYRKFFNYGEPNAVALDWNNVSIYEKVDGSMVCLWYYNDQWNVSTLGMADARGRVLGWEITFEELFWETWKTLGYKLPVPGFTYMFELMTPANIVLVRHKGSRIVLHGVRKMSHGYPYLEQLPDTAANTFGWECVKLHKNIRTTEGVITACENIMGTQAEGFVAVDKNFNRLKFKTLSYIRGTRIKNNLSLKDIIDLVIKGNSDDLALFFPGLAVAFDLVRQRIADLVADIEETYHSIEMIKEDKEFAFEAMNYPYSGALFCLRKEQISSAYEWIRACKIKHVIGLIETNDLIDIVLEFQEEKDRRKVFYGEEV